jgi:5-formyltetrahydrofolate cyclo-ligase
VKANPDSPQLPVRRRARKDGKTLYMAVPRLAEEKPFVAVRGDPTIKRALKEGTPLDLDDLEPVDLIFTPTEIVRTNSRRRPPGILRDHLDDEKRAAIPVLREH